MTYLRTLLLTLLLAIGGAAHAQTFPPLSGRVVDAANLLSPEQEAQLTQLSAQVEQASSRQFVVATIPDLQGYPIEDYGYKLGRNWNIGQKGANNGIILIVAPAEHKVRIEVGYGLEPIMTDALSSQIIDDTILSKFKAGDMAGGIVDGANAIGEQMKMPLEAAEQRAQQATAKVAAHPRHSGGGIPFGLVIWLFVLGFVVLSRFRGGAHGRRHSSGLGNAILWGALMNSGRGGGSSWGGGGGSGWGGGGGGFSGGGGSFGGGGASGSW